MRGGERLLGAGETRGPACAGDLRLEIDDLLKVMWLRTISNWKSN
jgi:hypothetical protein